LRQDVGRVEEAGGRRGLLVWVTSSDAVSWDETKLPCYPRQTATTTSNINYLQEWHIGTEVSRRSQKISDECTWSVYFKLSCNIHLNKENFELVFRFSYLPI
jgi:O-succinylbenzoate synthase